MTETENGTLTRLLMQWREGDRGALEELLPLVYDELHKVARRLMRSERPNHTLQPTALIHEAFGRLLESDIAWVDRVHFFAVVAKTMRRVLVNHANARARQKRGEGAIRITVDDSLEGSSPSEDILALDEALGRLAQQDDRKSQLVELHYFGGLSYKEMATALELSTSTVHRELRLAKAWLYQELKPRDPGPP